MEIQATLDGGPVVDIDRYTLITKRNTETVIYRSDGNLFQNGSREPSST